MVIRTTDINTFNGFIDLLGRKVLRRAKRKEQVLKVSETNSSVETIAILLKKYIKLKGFFNIIKLFKKTDLFNISMHHKLAFLFQFLSSRT